MTAQPLPIHPTLTDPRTGDPLRALLINKAGRPVWPILGAAEDPAPAGSPAGGDAAPAGDSSTQTAPAGDSPRDEQLGEAGKKALADERAARKAAEKKLAAFEKAESDRADAQKTEAERRAAAEAKAADAELRALRLEVAYDKGLTPAQAKRLVGTTREELEADAEEIRRDFPVTATPQTPAGPKPDPSQGSRAGNTPARPTSLGAAVASHYKG